MARRKKTTKAAKPSIKGNGSKDPSEKKENPLGFTGPVIDEDTGEKYFSRPDLSRYELAQYKLANITQGIRLKQIDIDRRRKEAEAELRQLQSQKEHLRIAAKKQSDELVRVQNALAELYDVDLSKISYDDATGRINTPEDQSPEAAGQPAAQ